MAKIGVFINLPENHRESGNRKRAIEDILYPPTHHCVYAFGEAMNNTYQDKANYLVGQNQDADVFIGTCWPTTHALLNAPGLNKPVVFSGLTTSPNTIFTPSIGIKSFDPDYLCPIWPALLKAIAPPSLTKVAVIYDMNTADRPGMAYQYQKIYDNRLGFDLTPIRADGDATPTNPTPPNPNIAGDITTFLQGVGNNPAGLIVTAGTRTTMLRDAIVAAVDIRNTTSPNKLFAIYPADFYMDTAGALLAYGPRIRNLYTDVINSYVMPIIKNQRPPSTSTNSPSNFQLTVSRRAAGSVNINDIPGQLIITLNNNQTLMLETNPVA